LSCPSVSARESADSSVVALTKRARVPGFHGRAPQRYREVGLADAGRSEDQDVLGGGDEAPGGELTYELLVHGWLELEVESLECLDRRKVRDLDAHRNPLALLGVDLLAEQLVEEIEVGRFGSGGGGENRVEALGDMAEVELGEPLDDASMDELAHDPPPTAAA
jgi:hypothetical protein